MAQWRKKIKPKGAWPSGPLNMPLTDLRHNQWCLVVEFSSTVDIAVDTGHCYIWQSCPGSHKWGCQWHMYSPLWSCVTSSVWNCRPSIGALVVKWFVLGEPDRLGKGANGFTRNLVVSWDYNLGKYFVAVINSRSYVHCVYVYVYVYSCTSMCTQMYVNVWSLTSLEAATVLHRNAVFVNLFKYFMNRFFH